MNAPSNLSDAALTTELHRLAQCEREATGALITHLAEFDARRLYRGAGFDSMFAYCTGALHLSEGGAYNRIEVARAARRYPALLDALVAGALTVATARLLAPRLTVANAEALIGAAGGKSKTDVERLVAAIAPRADVKSSVRKLPKPRPKPPMAAISRPLETEGLLVVRGQEAPTSPPAAAHRQAVRPMAPDRYEIRFTASEGTREKLLTAQALLRHAIPDGDPAAIVDRALTALLEDLSRKKFAETGREPKASGSAASTRHVPARVRRAVWLRDHGRCAFVAQSGHRCEARGFLEFHHARPYAAGGEATVDNIQLRCRTHNAYEAELFFADIRGGNPGLVNEPRAAYVAASGRNSSRDEFAAG